MLSAQKAGDYGTGDEKQQVDTPGRLGSHMQHRGEPEDQKTAASDAQAGEKPQNRADDHGYRQTF